MTSKGNFLFSLIMSRDLPRSFLRAWMGRRLQSKEKYLNEQATSTTVQQLRITETRTAAESVVSFWSQKKIKSRPSLKKLNKRDNVRWKRQIDRLSVFTISSVNKLLIVLHILTWLSSAQCEQVPVWNHVERWVHFLSVDQKTPTLKAHVPKISQASEH